jgi:hypothetical protein
MAHAMFGGFAAFYALMAFAFMHRENAFGVVMSALFCGLSVLLATLPY